MKSSRSLLRFWLRAPLFFLPWLPVRAEPVSLYAENFDLADDSSAYFPPADGAHRTLGDGRVNGWASGGVVRLSFARGAGVNGGGGLLMTPAEGGEDTLYYLASIHPIAFAGRTGADLSLEDVRGLRLAFSLRLPPGRRVNCSIHLVPSSAVLESDTWKHRLSLPPLVGTGSFVTVSVAGHSFSEEALEGFLATARKLGERRLRLAIQWYVADAGAWTPGDSLALDEIRLTLDR